RWGTISRQLRRCRWQAGSSCMCSPLRAVIFTTTLLRSVLKLLCDQVVEPGDHLLRRLAGDRLDAGVGLLAEGLPLVGSHGGDDRLLETGYDLVRGSGRHGDRAEDVEPGDLEGEFGIGRPVRADGVTPGSEAHDGDQLP